MFFLFFLRGKSREPNAFLIWIPCRNRTGTSWWYFSWRSGGRGEACVISACGDFSFFFFSFFNILPGAALRSHYHLLSNLVVAAVLVRPWSCLTSSLSSFPSAPLSLHLSPPPSAFGSNLLVSCNLWELRVQMLDLWVFDECLPVCVCMYNSGTKQSQTPVRPGPVSLTCTEWKPPSGYFWI